MIMGNIVAVLGTIGSLVIAYQNGLVIRTNMYSMHSERSWIMTIAWFIGSMLSVAILCTILYSIVEILDNQERLLKAKQTAQNVKNNDAPSTTGTASLFDRQPNKESWKCPQCGTVNPHYTGTCSCGYSKH
jgi:hypothetical protein